MIYFESFKLVNNPYENYGLTWDICDQHVIISTTENNEYTKSLFLFLKNRKNYEHGRCFVDDINIMNLDQESFNNFKSENFIFLDDDFIVNEKWNIRKISSIYKPLLKNKNDLNDFFNVPISKLSVLDKVKLLFKFILESKQKYVFLDLIDKNLNDEEIKKIYEFCLENSKKFNKQIIIFLNNEIKNNELINNIDKKYFYNNQILTISKTKYYFNKNKVINKKILFSIFLKLTIWDFLVFSLISIFLSIISFLIFSCQFISNENYLPPIIKFAKSNKILWNCLGTITSIFLITNTILWFLIINKKINKYLLFVNCFGRENRSTISNTIITFYILLLVSILISNLITWWIVSTLSDKLERYWFMINIFISIILLLFIGIFITININSKISSSIGKINTIKILL